MANFARALCGSESTFKMILVHGIPGDFAAAMVDLPRRANGKTVSLKPVTQQAAQLAETIMSTMERLAAEATRRLSRGAAESASER